MSTARRDLNHIVIPRFSMHFTSGEKILFVGVDPKWDYKHLFPGCTYQTLDKMKSRHPNILADIQDCPQIEDNLYDGIIMTGVYEYLQQPQKAMHEVYRILKPGGLFLFCAPGVAYYGDSKPTVTLRRMPDILKDFLIKEIHISYYIGKDPYYIHTTAIK